MSTYAELTILQWLTVGGFAAWGLLGEPPRLALAAASTVALAMVALWEWGSFHGGWIDRMEERGWRLGGVLRRRMDRRRARREAEAARKT